MGSFFMSALASLFVNAKVKFSIVVDGKRVAITLPDCPEGYSPDALAAHFKAKIGKSKRTEPAMGVELVKDEIGVVSTGPHVGDFAAAHFARFVAPPVNPVPPAIADRMGAPAPARNGKPRKLAPV